MFQELVKTMREIEDADLMNMERVREEFPGGIKSGDIKWGV